jgi:glycosyltransferase involved in cell wall biosynthesis
MDFSVVIPVHNESKFLPYSLPSVYNLNPSEVILIFDRCTDSSIEVASKIVKHYDPTLKITKFIYNIPDEENNFTFRVAFIKYYAISIVSYDTVLMSDADIILNPEIKNQIKQIEKFPFLCFAYFDFPVNWRNVLSKLINKIPLWQDEKLTGIYAFSVKVQKECEDIEDLKQITLGEDTHLQNSIKKKYPVKHFTSTSIHLRPRENSILYYQKGIHYWTITQRSLIKTTFQAIIFFRLNLLKGYIHARYGGIKI